ncbi:hypothetical protein DICPUDRAFT_151317 [Dictyostelium purpureum]|uniref:Aminotransferase class I/classII domain-containing protein n=1 Tax=Dictyostelium purpureum TaxID=5786 RepID=F0ZIJ5_DICPU|nr:uncharacterized protein DICPUDRAFT_151317 [Dictyostelium purpureum]EGC36236.1 hypothetical protein DICPUDRAFT_151317 [Dictyostelium purpureum]|eukprot:XP_003287245.1 hypothetical protein DICPUDRAFT_151317 [Dictyostelium purpureum]
MIENSEGRVIQEIKGNNIYCRSISPPQIEITEKYTDAHTISGHNIKKVKLYGKIAVSGLSAIYLTFANLIKQEKKGDNINIIISDELYCDTPKIIKSFNCPTTEINVCNPASILQHFQGLKNENPNKTNILFFESASNPNGNIFPFDILPKLKQLSKKLIVVVDNTWLTHVILNPFKFSDVEIVVNSCSKYYSASKCISGMILSKNANFMYSLESMSKLMGYHVSVDYCKLLLANFGTMEDRIMASYKNTLELTKVLSSYKNITIRNSSNPNDSSHQLALTYYNKSKEDPNETIHPSIINVIVNKPIDHVKKQLEENNIITKTSFGSCHTKVCNFMKSLSPQYTQIRISVGYDKIDFKMFEFLNSN